MKNIWRDILRDIEIDKKARKTEDIPGHNKIN